MKQLSTLLFTAIALTAASLSAAEPLQAIHVADNGRCFVKADGTPFFWLGDTAWCIFNHPTPADVDLYLDDRAAKGFTVIQGCVAVWDFATRRNPDGQTPFIGRDPKAVNDAYFTNVDSIIAKATARGLYVALLPFWTKNTRTGPFADPDGMKIYCRYLAQRYATNNIFWVLGGDTAGTDIQPVIDAEAAGLLEGAGTNKIIITYHPTGRESSSFWFHDRPWLDFNSIQSGHFIHTTNFKLVADDFAKTPAKPTLDMEPGYENITDRLVRGDTNAIRIQAVDVRRSAYLAVFAGAAGHTYGNGEVYEFYHPNAARAGTPGWHANMEWQDALKLPASGQVQFLRYLIESRPMLGRIPDQTLLADGDLPVLERVEATRATDGSYAFIYSADGKPFTLQTGKLSGEKLVAWWYDPRTGETKQFDSFAKTGTREFTPPTSGPGNDWVLVLDDAGKKFPAPGKPKL
jgi:Protein of unknown function (DUF4038)/Putative collagen-binding domain of a collagenase